jgi:hypothetical protein
MLGGDPLAEKGVVKDTPLTQEECVNAYTEAKLSEFRSEKHSAGIKTQSPPPPI